ncbi:MAG TPA: BON domain-containing protein [Spongiibacteraceae bacterium]|jgi:osmotically-inducible protein OsmY
MMKNRSSIIFSVIVATAGLLMPMVAQAAPAAERQFIDGTVMASQIKNKLTAEGFADITQINVEADDAGVVRLKGIAASDAEAARAVAIAKEMDGVVAVQSEIAVKRIQ